MEYELILAQYKDAVDKSSIFSKTDVHGRITYVNDVFCTITGYTREELIGQTHAIIKDPSTPQSLFKELWLQISAGHVWRGMLRNKKKDGGHYYVNSTIYPIKNDDGKILEYISIRQDITDLIHSQKMLEIYSTDTLTHLPNRQKLSERLDNNEDELMSIILDIKDFALINDFYGETIANKILLEVSLQLKNYLSDESTTLYKLDADRYLILVSDKNLFEKYDSLIKFTFLSDEDFIINDIIVTFNIGVAYGSLDLLSRSSLALKEAKKTKSRCFVYDKSIDTKTFHQNNIKKFNDFKDALLNDRIEPFFQPIVDAHTHEIVKYESLARIIDKEGNILAIADFLNIAEKSSFFENFTRQMIQKIFTISKKSNQAVTINLTYENISSASLLQYIENRLQSHKGPAITFELLESEEIEDYTILENFVKTVKKYGALIAIDDFGTGYSNFTHLTKFQADFLKIDGSIISGLEHDENSKHILSILIEYAKRNDIQTIAEYVSTPEIAKIVKDLGVDLLQGYQFGKAQRAQHYKLDV